MNCDKMSEENLTRDEYEMQHYTFNAKTFYEAFKSSVKEKIDEQFDLVTKATEEYVDWQCDWTKFNDLHSKYLEAADEVVIDMKPLILNFFSIPANIVLDSDEGKGPECESAVEILKKQVEELEKTYIQDKMYLAYLQQELEELKALAPLNEKLKEYFALPLENESDTKENRFKEVEADHSKLSKANWRAKLFRCK